MKKHFLILLFLFVGSSLAAQNVAFTVYLLGDAGEPSIKGSEQIKLLEKQLMSSGENSAIILLGDNIYPKGLPPAGHHDRQEAETAITGQLEILKDYPGQVFVIPGNHDWQKGHKKGWQYVQNQEAFVEAYLDSAEVFFPEGGCPGPVEIELNNEITLVIVDSQWVLHPWEKPRLEEDCIAKNSAEVLEILDDILKRNAHKKVIVATHHPMFTYGIHGGSTTLKDHLFPLTEASDNLYIPLPIIGSIYPIYRKYIGNIQDTRHPKYKAMIRMLTANFEQYPDLVHVSGHEHSLQYITKDQVHYVVSGSGSKTTHVKQKKYSEFAAENVGFGRLVYFDNGKVDLEFWTPGGSEGTRLFHKELMVRPYEPLLSVDDFADKFNLSDSVVRTRASDQYNKKESSYWILGGNYRRVWGTDVDVPVFDIGSEHGGLKIVQRGGGMQTKSLRLEASDGKQYVLRSIEKFARKAVPEALRETFAADLIQDQISASHPYGAFVVPELATAAEVYHTNPKVVFIPDDPRFGPYQSDFANTLALYEERPARDWSDAEFFGNSEKILSTSKMLEKLYKDNDNYVDQKWVLKSRMFDLFLADWDRHDDQWRWASFEDGKGEMFRPIPRDRDQTFFVNQGMLMGLVKKKWAQPKFQGFDYEIKHPSHFMFNARYFDRDFLTELSREEWVQIVEELKSKLTDEVIENAIRRWPDEVYQITGEEVISKLKAQRENLMEYAMHHYLFLAGEVNIRGSNKKEYFRVERIDDENTRIRVYKASKKDLKRKKIYDRTFKTSETKEVRLYGLGGHDEFEVTGEVKKGIKIRIIGGEGNDRINDQSKVGGPSKKTIVYDTRRGNLLELGSESKDKTSFKPEVNEYNRKEYQYPLLAPLVLISGNRDDGLFIGGGFIHRNHGFRKHPFRSSFFFLGSHAVATEAFQFIFNMKFIDTFGKLDLAINTHVRAPNYTANYFGIGNETVYNQNADQSFNVERTIDYYRTRYTDLSNEILLEARLGEFGTFAFGNHFQSFEVENDYNGQDRFVLTDPFSADAFEPQFYNGGVVKLTYDHKDNPMLPTRGIYFDFDARAYAGLNDVSSNYGMIDATFAFYATLHLPAQLTFATRIGTGHTFGDFEFYQGQILDGNTNMRGFRQTRFVGESKFYNNTELRLKLFTFRNPIVPLTVGLTAFHDYGRVWFDTLPSDKWHQGYGGGIWFSPLNAAVLAFDLGKSEEETLPYVRLGFLF